MLISHSPSAQNVRWGEDQAGEEVLDGYDLTGRLFQLARVNTRRFFARSVHRGLNVHRTPGCLRISARVDFTLFSFLICFWFLRFDRNP